MCLFEKITKLNIEEIKNFFFSKELKEIDNKVGPRRGLGFKPRMNESFILIFFYFVRKLLNIFIKGEFKYVFNFFFVKFI